MNPHFYSDTIYNFLTNNIYKEERKLYLKNAYRSARLRAVLKVNTELIKIYWETGNTILEQQKIKAGALTLLIALLLI